MFETHGWPPDRKHMIPQYTEPQLENGQGFFVIYVVKNLTFGDVVWPAHFVSIVFGLKIFGPETLGQMFGPKTFGHKFFIHIPCLTLFQFGGPKSLWH